jgi:hypothetical protein
VSTPPATFSANLAQGERADGAGVLDDLEAAEDVALGVGQRLALLGGEARGELLHVAADQLLELQHDAGALADRDVAPGLERLGRDFTALSTSAASHIGTRASTSWVAGLTTSRHCLAFDSTNLPSSSNLTV